RLRRPPAPGPGAVRVGRGGYRRAPAARPHPGRPARLRLDQRRAEPLDDHPRPPHPVRPDLADPARLSPPGALPPTRSKPVTGGTGAAAETRWRNLRT